MERSVGQGCHVTAASPLLHYPTTLRNMTTHCGGQFQVLAIRYISAVAAQRPGIRAIPNDGLSESRLMQPGVGGPIHIGDADLEFILGNLLYKADADPSPLWSAELRAKLLFQRALTHQLFTPRSVVRFGIRSE